MIRKDSIFPFCLAFFCFTVPFSGLTQTGDIGTYFADELRLAMRVKQIDEFFERFNLEPSLARDYLEIYYPERMPIPREQHLWWIMDHSTQWDSLRRDSFLLDIRDPNASQFLRFYDRHWFAELTCRFRYQGKLQDGKLVLHVQTDDQFASKWVISSISADFVPDSLGPNPYPIYHIVNRNKLIRPTNHIPYFAGLSRVFRDSSHISHYFSNQYTSSSLFFLEEAVKAGDLSVEFVQNIRYHFLQLDDWIVTVEEYNRKSYNAGWLISEIIPASQGDKRIYMTELLNLQSHGD